MSDMPKLTARQQQILQLVQHAIARTGAPPTRAEIAAELGFKSAIRLQQQGQVAEPVAEHQLAFLIVLRPEAVNRPGLRTLRGWLDSQLQ